MASLIPPPLFLSTPGDPPIPWADWKLIFQAYADAAGEDAAKPERRKALFINALGYAGLKLYQTLSSANASETPASSDVFQAALALFDDHFKRRVLMSVADSSKKARPSLFQKPSRLRERMNLFVCSWSNSLRTQCSNFLLRGAMAPVLCFTGRANKAALLLRLGAAVNMAARLHSPFVAVNMAAPPRRGVGEAVNMATPSGCYFPCSSSSCVCSGCTFCVCTAFYSACIFCMCSACACAFIDAASFAHSESESPTDATAVLPDSVSFVRPTVPSPQVPPGTSKTFLQGGEAFSAHRDGPKMKHRPAVCATKSCEEAKPSPPLIILSVSTQSPPSSSRKRRSRRKRKKPGRVEDSVT
ncbi:hypothetical protein HPB52_013939 [Rhipicephalus sanguineus]|uniref:Uncharacterized protein n=1 Tax=Rhipicephalus sanguineus TaxID=34632 RepID=A0A9D4PZZ9_RHISA|nr:hypothetical protein HPB52_013939 [Rhipicephalus sanguineus]